MAIQDHLRQFQYVKEQHYPDSLEGLWQFLNVTKAGFCEHFASAMAIMLRTLDIPARVATGFTVGSPIGTDTYRVTTGELHAWVEVPFETYGWLPFEPTPGGMVNPSISYTTQPQSDRPCPPHAVNCNDVGGKHQGKGHGKHEPINLTQNKEQSDPVNRPLDPSAVPHRTTTTASPLLVIAALGLLTAAFLVAVPLVRWHRRWRAVRGVREPRELILATYDVFSERAADLGLGRGPGETPREYRRRIEATDLLNDGHMERLTGTVVRAAYSTRPVTRDDALDVAGDAEQVIQDLRRATPLRRRLLRIYRRD